MSCGSAAAHRDSHSSWDAGSCGSTAAHSGKAPKLAGSCGSAAAHSGKPPAYRRATQKLRRLRLRCSRAGGIASKKKKPGPESRRLSAMCCGKAAILLYPVRYNLQSGTTCKRLISRGEPLLSLRRRLRSGFISPLLKFLLGFQIFH
jgi:hypothetical protein